MRTSSEQQRNKINSLVQTCQLLVTKHKARPEARKSDIMYYQMLADYTTRVKNAQEEGNFVAAHTIFFPTEILYAMDIIPLNMESISWMTALVLGEQAEFLSSGAELGLAPEICSPHRLGAGAFASGALPRPDTVLWSNMVCDNNAKCGELLMEVNDCPGFFLDHPFQDTKAEVKYLIGELEDMILFLEEKSGRRMDWDRLAEIVSRADREIELFREISELRKAIPSPFHPQGFIRLFTTDYLFPGQPEAIEYLETVRQEMEEMVREGTGFVSPERFRLMTLFLPPMYLVGFLGKISQEYGFTSVTEPFFTYWGEGRLDPAQPLESIAKKLYLLPIRRSMYGPLDERTLKDIVDCAEQYKVDGALYWANMGCRHTCATVKLFKDILSEVDVPMLTLDCDVMDTTVNSEEEIRVKLEQFVELLEDR